MGVGLTEPFLAAGVLGMVGLAAGAGFGIFGLSLVALEFVRTDRNPFRGIPIGVGIAFGGWILAIPVAALWLIRRRRILRMPRPQQWFWALAADCAVVGGVVLFMIEVWLDH